MQIKCTYFFEKVKIIIWLYVVKIVDCFDLIDNSVLF